MEEKFDLYEKQIQVLKGESSSSHVTKPTNPTKGLTKALADLNMKGDEIEKMKNTLTTQKE